MKKMKRLVAVLLAGIMALAMLTACGGTAGTPVTRDEALEKNVAAWAVEWGKEAANLKLTEDADLTAISAKCLPAGVKMHNAMIAMDKNAYVDAQKELLAELESAANGKRLHLWISASRTLWRSTRKIWSLSSRPTRPALTSS